MRASMGPRPPGPLFVTLAVLSLGASSCAYYNTYYLAKRYYAAATTGMPYPVDKPTGAQTGNYQKSIDYAKKVIAKYPKSKWVDDAYLIWARALIGKEDPLQTINMLADFPTRYADSPLKAEAIFYLGVAQRQARKHHEALVSLDEYLEKAPNGELVPYAHLERSRALMSLNRPTEAAQAASQVIERFPKSSLVVRLRAARAEALLAAGDPSAARADFQALGLRAADDNERFAFLLREADCLEAARDYAGGLQLLTSALSNEPAPVRSETRVTTASAGADRYGQLTLRIGTLHLLAGRPEQALAAYRNVLQDYPKSPLGAEAQYRIGYTHETVLDDFDAARQEYAKVRDQSINSAFFTQATQRLQSLERLARFRSAGADSNERKVEAGFLLAEQYLFQLDKPERALAAYADIAREHAGTAAAGKALNAEAWVLRRKLEQPGAADSLLWKVVREYPGTEAQVAARDYLETAGQVVPPGLIRLPERETVAPDTSLRLTPPPEGSMPLGVPPPRGRQVLPPPTDSLDAEARAPGAARPSLTGGVSGALDSLRGAIAWPRPSPSGSSLEDSLLARPDTTRGARFLVPHGFPGDTTRRVLADTTGRKTGIGARGAAADTTRRKPGDVARRAPAD
ncbi:MAG: tetratricopeptide repeat protein, partial [Candidatus Eiseniibacteriota bacterium]